MGADLSPLRIAAAVEAGSLIVLVVNRLTVHHPFVTSATGPVHGTAYLAVIALALLASTAGRRARYAALVPGIGGYLALRLMDRVGSTTSAAPTSTPGEPAEARPENPGDLCSGTTDPTAGADSDTAVIVHALVKDFGHGRVVGPLTFAVPSGSVTGFIGPNGAGKTTTIRMLLGLIRPSGGDATILGQSVRQPARYLSSVGAPVEGPASYPGLSGRQNLRVHARLGGIPSARIDEVLDMVELTDRADDRVSRYSFGMRQRLGIAAALLPRPRLLVLDEPANGLDPHGIAELLLRRLADDGTTCLISSHLLNEIEHTCDHLVALNDGKIVFAGPRRDLTASRILLRPEDPDALPSLAEVLAGLGYQAHCRAGAMVIDAPAADAPGCNRAAMHAGITLAQLRPEVTGLEQAFLALTADQPQSLPGGLR
jgi:ABC-2 type transport system ATP-binding protein